ncbi:cytokine receptor common subunit beta-like [Coturnix japonica]|uniref:cytokine receptor common subunit beta-like n=1 Tax=Coturnix japonica TaxID=93934 RepID=UPI0013A5D17F|nr:cytokine receptor common subunit beta-like [Coturnix japonica]
MQKLQNKPKENVGMKTFILNKNVCSKDSMKMKGFCIFLLNLSLVFSDQAINESVPMKSLRCHNDYNSLVTCTWKEHSEAHALLGLTLYQRNVIQKVRLTTKKVQIHETEYLHLMEANGLGRCIGYNEVAYKREWESWEKAATRRLSNTTHCHLSHLIPGSRYVARVRARAEQGRGFSGQYSEWSTDVSWETPEDFIATSVIFGLFFRATPASAEEECSPVYEKALPHVPYVVQSCEILVSNISSQSQYQVSVRTKTEEKLIEAYKNIKVLPPANVLVERIEKQQYELRWKKHTLRYGFIMQKYQVQFWEHNQYEKLKSWCCCRQKKQWEENIPNPSKSLLIQSYLHKVSLRNRHASSQMEVNKCSLAENMDQPSFLQVVDRQTKILAESPEARTEMTEVSSAALDLQNPYQALNVPEHDAVVCPSQIPGHSFSVSRTNCADANITSQTAVTCFAFNGPYLYSPVTSSQSEMHQTLEVTSNPMEKQEKAMSLQYVTLPDKDSPQAAQRQEQSGAGPLQPFLLPDQKEVMRYLNYKREVSPLPTCCGKSTDVRTEDQKSPEAPGCPAFLQQCSLEYISTDNLSLPSDSDTTHLPLVTAGGKPCDPQEPPPSSDCSCLEVSPGKFGVMLPSSGQISASPETHLDAFGDYLDVHSGLHGPSELSKISLPFQQKGSALSKEQPLSEGNLVVLNPDSTEPVFLCQIGDYCFHSLKSSEKTCMSQEYPQIKKPSGGRTAPGKPVPDNEFTTGKEGDASKMQAIQLFKSLKSDDYFSWQQSLRITEIC